MSQVVSGWKPELSIGDNDDEPQSLKKKKGESSWASVRRYARIPLKILFSLATVYVCILSSERYFYFWVQTTIERTDMHVSEIDFPAVTIIPVDFIASNTSEKTERFARAYNLLHSVLWQTRDAAKLAEDNFTQFPEYQNMDTTTWGFSESWQMNCENFFLECTWRHSSVNCCDIFRPTTTFKGYGYVFNSILVDHPDETWPWTVAFSGSYSGLNVKINRKQGPLSINKVGVIVHEPTQYLGMSIDYSSEDRIVVPVEPLRFTAEVDVRARPLQMRRCFFQNEIKAFGQSRSECIYKCHLKYLLEKCHCVLPIAAIGANITEASDSEESHPCNIEDLSCVNKHKLSLFSMSNIIEESRDKKFTTIDCGCFPQCDHTQYHTSTYTERLSTFTSHTSEIEIDVYFQEETLFSYRSMLRFTLIDLMVSYGGIAGLIMGVSVLGGVNAFLDHFACCRLPQPN
ncbi:hypothetical protein KR018_011883 [Drosophila ironensis]|nr:hypothetical protein KR018_011883 [Drosophila ironensis]